MNRSILVSGGLLLTVLLLTACGSTSGVRSGDASARQGASAESDASLSSTGGDTGRPVALIDGSPIQWSEIRPILLEAAGAAALEELALDRLIAIELARTGRSVSKADIDRERDNLLASLSPDRNIATRLLDEVRRRDNLGPKRFEDLLKRNAGLRMLVRDEVRLSPEALAQAYDMTAGPKRQVRIITISTLTEAERTLDRLRAGAAFSDVAADVSTDRSAVRGGLLEPFARSDVSYPQALREAVFSLSPGQLSSPILLDNGYAIALLEREIPATGASLESMRPQLERSVRLAQERLLMDQLARRLLRESRITVIDDDLNESWRRRTPPGASP